MLNVLNQFKIIFAGIAAAASAAFGGIGMMEFTLVAFIFIDYLTGLITAAINRNISSTVGWKGLLKKICIILVFAAAMIIDEMAGMQRVLRDAVCTFYIFNEGISILENLDRAGLPLPSVLRQFFEKMRQEKTAATTKKTESAPQTAGESEPEGDESKNAGE